MGSTKEILKMGSGLVRGIGRRGVKFLRGILIWDCPMASGSICRNSKVGFLG